jgi:hypothetical protein
VRNCPGLNGGSATPSMGFRWNEHCVQLTSSKLRRSTWNFRQPDLAPANPGWRSSVSSKSDPGPVRRSRQSAMPNPTPNCRNTPAEMQKSSREAVIAKSRQILRRSGAWLPPPCGFSRCSSDLRREQDHRGTPCPRPLRIPLQASTNTRRPSRHRPPRARQPSPEPCLSTVDRHISHL